MQEGKVVLLGGLRNSYGKKTSKGKGERKRYTQPNTEFQRTARRNKTAFLTEQ